MKTPESSVALLYFYSLVLLIYNVTYHLLQNFNLISSVNYLPSHLALHSVRHCQILQKAF